MWKSAEPDETHQTRLLTCFFNSRHRFGKYSRLPVWCAARYKVQLNYRGNSRKKKREKCKAFEAQVFIKRRLRMKDFGLFAQVATFGTFATLPPLRVFFFLFFFFRRRSFWRDNVRSGVCFEGVELITWEWSWSRENGANHVRTELITWKRRVFEADSSSFGW